MSATALTADGNSRNNQTKKRRSLFWTLMRPGNFRRSTITWCRSAVFSAASRAFDVHVVAITANNMRISAIIAADASRILQRVKPDNLFGIDRYCVGPPHQFFLPKPFCCNAKNSLSSYAACSNRFSRRCRKAAVGSLLQARRRVHGCHRARGAHNWRA